MLSISRSRTAGEQATAVGQNAVTPIADQPSRDLLDRVERIERVEALDAVDVDVDEAGDQGVAVQIDEAAAAGTAGTGRARPRLNFRDPAVLDDDRPGRQDAVGQHHVGAAQDQRTGEGRSRSHGRKSSSPWLPVDARARLSPSVPGTGRRRPGGGRRYHSGRHRPRGSHHAQRSGRRGPRPGPRRARLRGLAQGPPGGGQARCSAPAA